MRKWWWLSVPVIFVLVALRWSHLDTLWWAQWRLADKSRPASGINLAHYRADIDGRVIQGVDDNLSGLAYNRETGNLWAVLNGEPLLLELDLEGRLLRRVRVDGVQDMEGLAHVSGNRFVIAEERNQRLLLVDVPPQAGRLDAASAPSLTLGLDQVGNKGFEGVSWDARSQRLLVVKERDPLRVLAVTGFVERALSESAPMQVRITELQSPASPGLLMRDLSSLVLHEASGHLLLLSDQSRLLAEYGADGELLSVQGLWAGMGGLRRTVPQAEGVALDAQGRLYLVSEPNLFYRFSPLAD